MFTKPKGVLTGLSKLSMTSTYHGSSKIELNHWHETVQNLMHSRLQYELLQGLMDFVAFLVDKLWQKW